MTENEISRVVGIGGFRKFRQNIDEATNRGTVDRNFRYEFVEHEEWID